MKLFRLFLLKGVFLALLLLSSFIPATAQQAAPNHGYNTEALWSSYDHNAFHRDLQTSLGLDAAEYDAFQKYLIQVKKTWRDQVDFFTKAQQGIINPMNINAFFNQLKTKYFGYYPAFKTYSDSLNQLAVQRRMTGNTLPGILACGSPCTNPGYETNDFTSWIQQEGSSVNGTGAAGVNLSPGTGQTSITSPGPDPVVGTALNQVFPGGGTHSAMIGDGPNTGAMAGSLATSFTVSATTTNFTYAYAVVLQDPGHPTNQQPYFFLTLTDQAGNVLPCGSYSVIAGPSVPDFTETSPGSQIWYRNWTAVFVDLTPYIGQCVTMTYVCRDCTQGGHYGYAYVDASCAPAQIITSSPAICGSSTITLTAPPGASAYSWTGPGIVGSNAGQTISVNVAGTYTVVMTSSMGGCTTTLTINVPGNPTSPLANFSSTPVCAGLPMNFTDLSKPTGQITAWLWDFGGGHTDSVQNPTYTFPAAGTYPVHLTITWPPCTHDTIINVTVSPAPTPAFTAQPVCAGSASVFITTSTATTYAWTFGDGTTGNTQDPTHTYPTAGTYTASLEITTASGCSGIVQQAVVVNTAPLATFSVPPVCLNGTSTFNNTSTGGNSQTWTFGDATTSTNVSPTHTYGTAGTFTATLTVVGPGGCTSTATEPVVVNPPPTVAYTNSSVCVNTPTTFTDASSVSPGSISTWTWNFGDGSTSASENPTHTYPTAGTYTTSLVATTSGGCVDSISHVVSVYALPVVKFAGDSLIHCTPWCVNFNDSSAVNGGTISHWTWNFGDGSPVVTQNALATETHCYTSPGTYGVTLTITSAEGCSSSLNKPSYITTWPLPVAAFSASPQPTSILDPTVNFTDQSTLAVNWYWNFGDGDTLSPNTANPTHLYNGENPGTYTVQLIVKSIHGCMDTTEEPVIIGPIYTFFAPNCFTPNDDGKNDLFYTYGVGWDTYELIIVDRWGNLLFTTHDVTQGWDGKVQGSGVTCQEDTYVWKVNITDVFNIPHHYMGRVSIVR
jgi:gliding motility-associated-like protein